MRKIIIATFMTLLTLPLLAQHNARDHRDDDEKQLVMTLEDVLANTAGVVPECEPEDRGKRSCVSRYDRPGADPRDPNSKVWSHCTGSSFICFDGRWVASDSSEVSRCQRSAPARPTARTVTPPVAPRVQPQRAPAAPTVIRAPRPHLDPESDFR